VIKRGEYLVTGPGHCGACHTPRGVGMQETALTNTLGPSFLSGGTVIDGWVVPSLRGGDADGLGRWTDTDIVTFLKTGRIEHAAVFGGMTDVVAWSTRHFTDGDLVAVAKYLKTLSPEPGAKVYQYDATVTAMLDSGKVGTNNGARVYVQQCAICHRTDGGGVARMFPPLAGNPVVTSGNPVSLVHIVAMGGALPPSNTAPSSVSMPGYAQALSDHDIADVVNFIRTSWGNQAAANATAAMVAPWRRAEAQARGADVSGWELVLPQPYGNGWSFSPESHNGHDRAQ
jgi:mono/diheme cytochrome c family protein